MRSPQVIAAKPEESKKMSASRTIIITTLPSNKTGGALSASYTIKRPTTGPTVLDSKPPVLSRQVPLMVQRETVNSPPTVRSSPVAVATLGKRIGSNWENSYPCTVPPRKRERLTHLTPEEKLYRRKMKNRVAAQTARDRKKAKMGDLEGLVDQLEEENERLSGENERLQQRTSELDLENARLKQQLAQSQTIPPVAVGSAAFISAPLPREQVTGSASLWTLMLSLLTSIYNKSSTICSKEQNSLMEALDLNSCSKASQLTHKMPPLSRTQAESLLELWKAVRKKRLATTV